nr:MAG TPA: hypothetical protein [Caudoviricetes sp.]
MLYSLYRFLLYLYDLFSHLQNIQKSVLKIHHLLLQNMNMSNLSAFHLVFS